MARNKRIFQIFKAGTHVSSSGNEISFSESDLKTMAAVYDPALRGAPLTIGHPKDDKPDLGRVTGLIERGGNLYAEAEVSDALVGKVRSNQFKSVSASFFHPRNPSNPMAGSGRGGAYYLKHVGFLGATPPAVKGMMPLSFSESPTDMCFSESVAPPSFAEVDMSQFEGMDPDRVRHHLLALSYQEMVPELSYAEAAAQVHDKFFR